MAITAFLFFASVFAVPRLLRAAEVPKPMAAGEKAFWEAMLVLDSEKADELELGRKLLRESADLECPIAQCVLGECYLGGRSGFKKDERRAAESFRLAAERGYSPAKAYVGICHALGSGTRRNPKEARKWLEAALADAESFNQPEPPAWYFERMTARAAPSERASLRSNGPTQWENLCARAHYFLGEISTDSKQLAEALKHYEAAASGRAGIFEAARKAAMCYALGRGTKRDLAKADAMLELSRGLTKSTGLMFFQNRTTEVQMDDFDLGQIEKGVSFVADSKLIADQIAVTDALIRESPKEAVRWCEMAAEDGEGWAMIKLAEIHLSGPATERDPTKVFKWYERAAREKDFAIAWGNLAACHLRGIGTAQNEAEGKKIALEHKRGNYLCALVSVGLAPDRDLSLAGWWSVLERSAKNGASAEAQYQYARECLYRRHEDPDKFTKMLTSAAKAGIADAYFVLGQIAELNRKPGPSALDPAIRYYEQGATAGSSKCAFQLGMFSTGLWGQPQILSRALQYLKRAVELDPDDGRPYDEIAVILGNQLLSVSRKSDEYSGLRDDMFKFLEESSRRGNAMATFNLGRLYYEGKYCDLDFARAYGYLQTAAEAGYPDANRYLGRMHERGEGVPVTLKEAFYYYRLAAADNDLDALRSVCDFYLNGKGVSRDPDRAMFWFEKLAQLGDLSAGLAYGDLLLTQGKFVEALAYWEKAAASADKTIAGYGFDRLSRIYREGLGVAADPVRAEKFAARAIEAENPEQICRLARQALSEKHPEKATELFKIAAQRGSADARYMLGFLRYTGGLGFVDKEGAIAEFREAARLGFTDAMIALAVATLEKIPGAPDLDEAIQLVEAAEAAGHPKAKLLRAKLEARRPQAPVDPNSGKSQSA